MQGTLLADSKPRLVCRDDDSTVIQRLVVLLVKPSKYDEDGYVLRFWKGVLPSNSLAVMYTLTQ